jgi:hypothetical protein
MARVIRLDFPPADTELLLPTVVAGPAGAVSEIPLASGYPFVFPKLARTITFTSTDDLSGVVFGIDGIDQLGKVIGETLNGPNNNTVSSVYQYNTITNLSSDDQYTNLSIGSGTTGTFQWVKLNTMGTPNIGAVSVQVFNTINYSLYETVDEIEFYKNAGPTYQYLYPTATYEGQNPLSTVNGSGVVTVTLTSTAGLKNGDLISIIDAIDTHGITAAELNITAPITVIDETHFSYITSGTANATGTGGGNYIRVVYPNLPFYANAVEASHTTSSYNVLSPILTMQLVVNSSSNGGALVANILQEGIK